MNLADLGEACRTMASWLETEHRRYRIRLSYTHRPLLLERFQHTVELSLLLYSMTNPAQASMGSPLSAWAERIAAGLAEDADQFGDNLNWDETTARAEAEPAVALALMFFPLLEIVTARPSRHTRKVAVLMKTTRREPVPSGTDEDSLWFLHSLLGWNPCSGKINAVLAELDSVPARPSPYDSSVALYDLTHAVFFTTHFGHRSPEELGSSRSSLIERLGERAMARMECGDHDLGAELLYAALLAGAPLDRPLKAATEILVDSISNHGYLFYTRGGVVVNDRKAKFHTTLVGLMALAAIWARASDLTEPRPKATTNVE
jgi:hypothetical protein